MRKWICFGLTVVALGIGCMLALPWGSEPALALVSPRQRPRHPLMPLARQLAHAEPARGMWPAAPPSQHEHFEHRSQEPLVTAAPVAPGQPSAEPAEPEPQAVVAGLDQRFQAEPIDARWSSVAARDARDRLLPLLRDGSALRSLECRRSLCRVEIIHDSDGAQAAFDQLARDTSQPPWGGTFLSTRLHAPNGTTATIAYLVRDGHPIPTLPPPQLPEG